MERNRGEERWEAREVSGVRSEANREEIAGKNKTEKAQVEFMQTVLINTATPSCHRNCQTGSARNERKNILFRFINLKMKPACREGTVLLNLSSLNHTLLTQGFICLVGSDSWILPELFLVDRPGILNRMKHIPTRNSLFINANYMRRRGKKRGRERRPRRCGVPMPVSVICYLHLYTFFSFNKRRPGFSVTFMDSLFQKK